MLAAVAVIVFFLVVWIRGQMRRTAPVEEVASSVQRVHVSKFPSPTEEAALDIVKTALAVRDASEIGKYFRLRGTDAAEVVSFLETMHEHDGAISSYQWLGSMDANRMLLEGVVVKTQREDAQRNRIAFLTPDEQGTWKVDFDALARTVRPSWAALTAEDGGQGTVRVFLAKDSYFNGLFENEDEWLCFGMASPDTQKVLLGYCRRKSPQALAMEQIFRSMDDIHQERDKLRRAVLHLRRPQGAELRQFEITRVLAEDWVLGEAAFDGTTGDLGILPVKPTSNTAQPGR
jgi:hypothetical protein